LRAVEERRFNGVLFFVLAVVLLAAIYWVIYSPCPKAALTALFNSHRWLFFKVL